jgi:hypothetical protein
LINHSYNAQEHGSITVAVHAAEDILFIVCCFLFVCLSFSIPTDPNTISNSRNEFFAERLRKKEDLN